MSRLSNRFLHQRGETPISAGTLELRVWVFASDQSVEGFILRQAGASMTAKLVTDRFVQNKELEFNPFQVPIKTKGSFGITLRNSLKTPNLMFIGRND